MSYSTTGTSGETSAGSATALTTGAAQHIAIVVDQTNGQLILYLNGALVQGTGFTGALSQISDVNNWLGRSPWSGDYDFIGVFDEFRIYNAALTGPQIATSRAMGPNPAFLN